MVRSSPFWRREVAISAGEFPETGEGISSIAIKPSAAIRRRKDTRDVLRLRCMYAGMISVFGVIMLPNR